MKNLGKIKEIRTYVILTVLGLMFAITESYLRMFHYFFSEQVG